MKMKASRSGLRTGKFSFYSQLPEMRVNADRKMVIHSLDLTTHQISALDGSEGLHSAHWSPDGSHIVASAADDSSLMALELATRKWRLLSRPGGRVLGWSRHDTQIYF